MITTLTLTTVLSVLLTLAASGDPAAAKKVSTDQPKEELVINKEAANRGIIGGTISPSGVNLNHNETLIRDPK